MTALTHRLLDLNDDGIGGYEIVYNEFIWDGINSFGTGFFGRFNPLNDNSVLDSIASSLSQSHTVELGSTLTTDAAAAAALRWDTFRSGPSVVSITSQGTNSETWPTTWTRSYAGVNDELFIGLKLAHAPGATPTLGWVELSVDVNSGKITVLNKGFAVAEELVIGE